MYFIINDSDYIVASSKDFLEAVGASDICNLSNAIKDKRVLIKSDVSTLSINDKSSYYSTTDITSVLGNLKLYKLSDSNNSSNSSEDDNIDYLKKIKEGTIKKRDFNYDIPDISRKETNQDMDTLTSKTSPQKLLSQEELKEAIEVKTEENNTTSTTQDLLLKELENITPKSVETKTEPQELLLQEEPKKAIEVKTEENNTTSTTQDLLLKELENITPKSIETKPEPQELLLQEEPKETLDVKTEESNTSSITKELLLKELEDITPKNIDTKPEPQELHLQEEPKEALDVKTEESNTNYTTLVTEEKSEDTEKLTIKYYDIIDDKIITEDEVVDNKVTKESHDLIESIKNIENATDSTNLQDRTSNLLSVTPEDSNSKIDENISLDNREDINSDIKNASQNDDISDDLLILMDDKDSKPKKGGLKLSKLFPWGSKKSKDSDSDLNISLEEQELEILRETTSKKENMEKLASNSAIDLHTEQTTQSDEIENIKQKSHIFSQLTQRQVDNINFSDNANKLSIDEDSYRLLLDNYLDELDNYENELNIADKATVEMMSDASSLLSLDIITKKLDSITKADNKELVAKEINLVKTLLKNKLNNSNNTIEAKVTQTQINHTTELNSEIDSQTASVTNIEEQTTSTNIKPPTIPTKAIDIESSEQLFQVIESISVDFDLEKPSSELNLPKPLILEFINDFITQSQEHLPVLVEAYKKRDIKTIKTTGHMLKGAASNLRLDSISRTLYKMQKEDNIEESGENIKEFVASLKGLKRVIEQIESNDNEN